MIMRSIISLVLSSCLFFAPCLAKDKKASFDAQAAFG